MLQNHDLDMLIAFNTSLLASAKNGAFDLTTAANVYAASFPAILAEMVYPTKIKKSLRWKQNWAWTADELDDLDLPLKPEQLFRLHADLSELHKESLIEQLFEHIIEQAGLTHHTLIVPAFALYLRDLVSLLQASEPGLASPKVQNLFVNVLEQLVRRYVEIKPVRPSLVRDPAGCKAGYCQDCNELDAFLKSSTMKAKNFILRTKADIKHLEKQTRHRVEYFRGTDRHLEVKKEEWKKPYTFTVTKPEPEYDRSNGDWKHRLEVAQNAISSIGTKEDLQLLLGSRFRELTLGATLRSQPVEQGMKRKASPDVTLGQAHPAKRPAPSHIIDLSNSS